MREGPATLRYLSGRATRLRRIHRCQKVFMQVFRSIAHASGDGFRAGVDLLIAALDGLTRRVGHLSERVETGLRRRTPQLRSRARPGGRRPLDLPFLHL